jgi:hypothetical protein
VSKAFIAYGDLERFPVAALRPLARPGGRDAAVQPELRLELGFKRRVMITNGTRLTSKLIDAVNRTVRACQERDAVAGWT